MPVPSSIQPFLAPGEPFLATIYHADFSRPNWSCTKCPWSPPMQPRPLPSKSQDRACDYGQRKRFKLQDGERTTVHSLSVFHIDSHSSTLSRCPPPPSPKHRRVHNAFIASRCVNSSPTSTHIHLRRTVARLLLLPPLFYFSGGK